jgi:membrane-associated phospholipid phosphatase
MYWKAEYQRPRPSRRSPMLLPPIDPPGHASFPSGHSTQAHLIARVLAQVMPNAVRNSYDAGNNPLGLNNSPLFRMAERLARNREVLGLHYPSDSAAGRRLAELAQPRLIAILNARVAVRPVAHSPPNAVDLIARAVAEWA